MSIKSLRKYRFKKIALFDLIASFIGMILLFIILWGAFFKKLSWWKFVLAAIILTIPTSILFHIIFGVNTQLNYNIGLSVKPTR